MEEAFAFSQLIRKGKTAEEVALRFGKTTRFVNDRLKLNTLVPDLKKAVRDGKMTIVAAQLICRLPEKDQNQYYREYSRFESFSKSNAISFLHAIFRMVKRAPWSEDFAGGCGRTCAECPSNTSNHGCLFWEMKDEDSDRCVDRKEFDTKLTAWFESRLDQYADRLVKIDGELDPGTMAISIPKYAIQCLASYTDFIERFRKTVYERGFRVIDPVAEPNLGTAVYYAENTDQTKEFLARGNAYRVLEVGGYGLPEIKTKVYYRKEIVGGEEADENGTPFEVKDLVREIANLRGSSFSAALALAKSKAIVTSEPPADLDLDDYEKTLLATLMLKQNLKLCSKLGVGGDGQIADYVLQNPDQRNMIIRKWIVKNLEMGVAITPNEALGVSEGFLDEIADLWNTEDYLKSIDAVRAKFQKKIGKAIARLEELGYDDNGKLLASNPDILSHYDEFKTQHPDAVLLFRVGDFYETYREDADTAAEALGLTVTTKPGGTKMCGFPHTSLDIYMPKLVRAGKRVAICENIEKK